MGSAEAAPIEDRARGGPFQEFEKAPRFRFRGPTITAAGYAMSRYG
jgi:hypothetical protein